MSAINNTSNRILQVFIPLVLATSCVQKKSKNSLSGSLKDSTVIEQNEYATDSYDFSGNYLHKLGHKHGLEISAHFERFAPRRYLFYVETINADGTCTGEVQDSIWLNPANVGMFHTEENGFCELEFQFFQGTRDSVRITESECEFHGLNCSFDGGYVKNP